MCSPQLGGEDVRRGKSRMVKGCKDWTGVESFFLYFCGEYVQLTRRRDGKNVNTRSILCARCLASNIGSGGFLFSDCCFVF